MKFKILISILIGALLLTGCTSSGGKGYKQINADEAAELMQTEIDYIILDVRRADEFADGHIAGAINIPNENIDKSAISELPDKDKLILVYCRSGRRSKEAAAKLVKLGYTNVVEFGGILDWNGETVKNDGVSGSEAAKATDFTVYDADMNKVKLSDFFGKPIVINFWASWCGPCKSELPAFNSMYKKYGDEVTFLMVNLTDTYREPMDTAKDFVAKSNYEFSVYYDASGNASTLYKIYSIPETVFINADGTIQDVKIGTMKESELEAYIKSILK